MASSVCPFADHQFATYEKSTSIKVQYPAKLPYTVHQDKTTECLSVNPALTGDENHLIFLLVLNYLIDLNYLKPPAIENLNFPAYCGTDTCVTVKILLELNLIGLLCLI